MSDYNFKTVMAEHSDESLIKVLKERNRYNKEARDAAIEEAVKREILLHKDYLDIVYPLKIEDFNNEISSREAIIDFRKNIYILYSIGIGTWLFTYLMQGSISPAIPIIYLGLIIYCSIKFSQTKVNLIIGGAVFQIATVISHIVSILFL